MCETLKSTWTARALAGSRVMIIKFLTTRNVNATAQKSAQVEKCNIRARASVRR